MTQTAAAILGFLTTILLFLAWSTISGSFPGNPGFTINLMALIASIMAGIIVYITFSRGN